MDFKKLIPNARWEKTPGMPAEPERIVLEYEPKECEDCGAFVKNRRIETRQYVHPWTHWRTRCTACKCFKDPVTGEFSIKSNHSTGYFKNYLRCRTRDK